MSKFLFVVPPFFGHVSPTLSVGSSLLKRGHEVQWVSLIRIKEEQIPEGGIFTVPETYWDRYGKEIEQILIRQDEGPLLSGVETWKLALEDTYIPFCKIMYQGLNEVINTFKPDVIVSDCITFVGGICAYQHGIPYVTTTPVPPDLGANAINSPKIWAWQQNLMFNLQKELGVTHSELIFHSQKLNLVFTSQHFAAIANPEPHMQFVGPVEGRPNVVNFDWNRLEKSKGPKVFVSLGTLLEDIRKEFFLKVIEAFKDEPLTIVAATKPEIIENWPENFIVQGFVPQTEVMKKMDMVICHGGFNTVNDAILNELPLLITPIAYDHFHTADLVEKAGCGKKIRYKRMRITDLRTTVWELIQNSSYKEKAGYVKQSFLDAGSNNRAVTLLEQMIRTEQFIYN
ncbi:glycosyltransferase [Olivibacter sp. CPCC 100613]|uniref:glycosyltransferase n=1 Tax=Olivibacter sp. CPCC 100613 TaxID=3079931 RepID=UPI002FF4DC5E